MKEKLPPLVNRPLFSITYAAPYSDGRLASVLDPNNKEVQFDYSGPPPTGVFTDIKRGYVAPARSTARRPRPSLSTPSITIPPPSRTRKAMSAEEVSRGTSAWRRGDVRGAIEEGKGGGR